MTQPTSVFIVEDELPARELLIEFTTARADLRLAGSARDADEAEKRLSENPCDLLFLDIELPGRSGLELLERLSRLPPVIFTTAHPQHAVHAFQVGAVDYLLKPFTQERFNQAVERALQNSQTAPRVPGALGLPIRSGDDHYLVPYDKILYLASHGKRSTIHTEERDFETARLLGDLETRLPPDFVRVHKQYIVNLHHIDRVQYFIGGRYTAYLRDRDETALPVGRSFAPGLRQRLGL